MNKEYTLESSNRNIEEIKSRIIQDLNQRIGAREDCKVLIQPLDARSDGQLKAYWCLIKAIQEWMIKEGNFYLKDEHDMIYNVSNKKSLSDYIKVQAGHCNKEYVTVFGLRYDEEYCEDYDYIVEPKSIASNSNCTREDMQKIINWILNFAANMVIPECRIKDTELENMLKFYDK